MSNANNEPGSSEVKPHRHILIPVDESPAAERVFDWTLDNVYREGDTMHVFRVIPPGTHVVLSTDLGIDEVVEDDEATQRRQEEAARTYLTKTFALKCEARQIPYVLEIVRFSVDNDSIGAIICKRAEQIQASAVVLAKHTKGAIKEFFVGSVTSHCTHHCRAPVIVLHAD